jgi:hypothetical protein
VNCRPRPLQPWRSSVLSNHIQRSRRARPLHSMSRTPRPPSWIGRARPIAS